jgi:predicted transcriptional regulator
MAEPTSLVNTTPLTVMVPDEVRRNLEHLSEQTGQDLSALVSEALAEYVAVQESQIASIKAAIAEADAGAPRIPHADVMAWIDSWDTPNELPPPA